MKKLLFLILVLDCLHSNSQTICAAADCTSTIAVKLDTLTLNGQVNTNATTYSCLWTVVQGSAVIIQPTAKSTKAVGLTTPGTYIFKLTAKNNLGDSAIAYDTVYYTFTPPVNQPPVAIIQLPPSVINSTSISVDATASFDPDGTIVKQGWGKISGPGIQTIQNASTLNPIITGLQTGIYVFKVTLWDNSGSVGSGSVTLNVNITKTITKIIATYSDGSTQQLFP